MPSLTYENTVWACSILFGIGIALIIGVVIKHGLDQVFASYTRLKIKMADRRNFDALPDAIKRAINKNESGANDKWSGKLFNYTKNLQETALSTGLPLTAYLVLVACLAVVGLFFGSFMLHNLIAGAALAFALANLPGLVLGGRKERRINTLRKQLGPAVRLFGAEFATTTQVLWALEQTAAGSPQPVKGVLEKCVRDLKAGINPETAFKNLGANLKHQYGEVFAELVHMAWDDSSVAGQFPKLAIKIKKHEDLEMTNATSLASMRIVGLFLNLLLVPAYFTVRQIVPEAGMYLINEPMGKVVTAAAFMSLPVGVYLDKKLHRVNF